LRGRRTEYWTSPDDRVLFDVTFNRDWQPGDIDPPATAVIRARAPFAEQHDVAIWEDWPTRFDLDFRSGLRVHGTLQRKSGVHIDGASCLAVFADIRCRPPGLAPDFHFDGIMVFCPMETPPAPPCPLPPGPDPDDPGGDPGGGLSVVTGTLDTLFPYVYVRRWPQVDAETLDLGFVHYLAPQPPPAFYAALKACTTRAAAEQCALDFINGVAPYAGDALSGFDQLSGPISDFAKLAERLRHPIVDAKAWMAALTHDVQDLLDRHEAGWSYFADAVYAADVDRIWQTYFACVATRGYDQSLVCQLALGLWSAHAIAKAFAPSTPGEGAAPGEAAAKGQDWTPRPLSPELVARLATASIVLPASIFPLPPAAGPAPASSGWLAPYAIGDLQMVRQRLVRYAPGDIARIDNVVRGERREISTRRLHSQQDSVEHKTADAQLTEQNDSDARVSLSEEAFRTSAQLSANQSYNDFKTSYGPPTMATLSGSWTRDAIQGPVGEDATRFARDVMERTVERIGRTVVVARSSNTLSQVENTVSSIIDNSRGDRDVRAVFRWVNKIYEAHVVTYGGRLMLEFIVPTPAKAFLARTREVSSDPLSQIASPADQGVRSFRDVSRANYADLCARYGVMHLTPPPAESVYVATVLRAGEDRRISVPVGYTATAAFARCVTTPPDLPPPPVLVGRMRVKVDASAAALPSYGETVDIPVSVGAILLDYLPPLPSPPSLPALPASPASTGALTSSSSPSSPSAPGSAAKVAADAIVNVEVQCVPTDRVLDEWRIAIFASIIRGYGEQRARYEARLDDGPGQGADGRSALANRQIVRRTLKGACGRVLIERFNTLAGPEEAGSPPLDIGLPRQIRFLDAALEWREMTYSFQLHELGELPGGAATEADAFADFLQAEQARVLVPVAPNMATALLYALSSGALWEGPDALAPIDDADAPLVADLKRAPGARDAAPQVGPAWEVIVPTSMQLVDSDDRLPRGGAQPFLPRGD
jgi:hypothetical protein